MGKVGNTRKDYSKGESYDDRAYDESSESQEPARHTFEISSNESLGVGHLINDVRKKSIQQLNFPACGVIAWTLELSSVPMNACVFGAPAGD